MLSGLFDRIPDVQISIQPSLINPDDHLLIDVHTEGPERSVVETSILSDPNVAAAEYLNEYNGGWAYRVMVDGHARRLLHRLIATEITILSARARNDQWNLRLLAPDRENIAQADSIMDDLGCAAECRSLSTVDSNRPNRLGLTDKQSETLVAAFEAGYYNVPQGVTMDELGEQLGVSHQALSERLHRAYKRIVENELM